MVKKVIQVPVDEILENLDNLSRKQRKARSEVIREACVRYLTDIEEEELDRIYKEGYQRIPEGPEIGEAQVAMLGEVLPEESW